MSTLALNAKLALPPGLTHADAEKAAVRFATLEVIDSARRDPFRLSGSIPRSMVLTYRGGLIYRGRPTRVWRFKLEPGVPLSTHHLVGVQAKRHAYYCAYPAILTASDDEDAHLAGRIAGDWRAYSERERVLQVYRQRLSEKPQDAARHYELALVGVTLGTYFLALSKVDALHYPGPLEEFAPIVQATIERAPGQPRYLALAAFLHERLTQFEQAARRYGEAAAADPKSELYAVLHADALLFAGDEKGATSAAKEAERRLRTRRSPYEFGLHRRSLLDIFKHGLYEDAWALRKKVEGLKDGKSDKALAEEHRRAIKIDRKKVPRAFHDLIPLARKWGVGDDPSRDYLTEHATARDKAALKNALPPKRRGEIQDWLDSLGPRGITGQEAGAFMYLLEALDELGI